MGFAHILVDDPAPQVRRVTLNRPEKRNAMNATMRAEILTALREADADPGVRVSIVRGAGPDFSAGYDLNPGSDQERYGGIGTGPGRFQRAVVDGWTGIWDLDKPVIAQVHGHCLAGATELATGCDLVYVAEDSTVGYPAARFAIPDMHYHAWVFGMRRAMEQVLTGDSMTGAEAAESGFANRAFPPGLLEEETLRIAQRITSVPQDITQLNKRAIHRSMEGMGIRSALRAGSEASALVAFTDGYQNFAKVTKERGVKAGLAQRDRGLVDPTDGDDGEES